MSSSIQTIIASSVFSSAGTLQSIEETIAIIREETHKKVVGRLRNIKDEDERRRVKLNELPVFFPTIRLGPDCRLDENSEPTGIVQFDIDKKSNPGIDIGTLKSMVIQHPACMYAFVSPSGGLKFGVLTDFARPSGEPIEVMAQRFKIAYGLCLRIMQDHCGPLHFEADPAVGQVRQSSFLSYDPDAFHRLNCTHLTVNDQCQVATRAQTIESTADLASVRHVLGHISPKLRYNERFKVNTCVLFLLGRPGVALLMDHWDTDRAKLATDLEDQFKRAKCGTLGLLQSYAVKYGNYKRSTGGTGRWYVQPQPCNDLLEPLATPEEATAKLRGIIRDFVTGKHSHFVNITAGAGKTRTVLELLSQEVSSKTKILFLAPTHALADEIVETFREIRAANIARATDLKGKFQQPAIVHLRSRKTLCENENARARLEENGIAIPFQYCVSQCAYRGECGYTEQFNSFANIRVMTHNEWFNEQSAWFNGNRQGTDGCVEPIRGSARWVPEYIIIDEDILKFSEVIIQESTARFPSVGMIIASVQAGQSLRDAVWAYREQVLGDSVANQEPQRPSTDLSAAEYAAEVYRRRKESQHSKVVAQLESYCRRDDPAILNGMWVEGNVIKWLPLPHPAERYDGIPTLYLDATAHPKVVQQCLPAVEFHRIAVRQRDDVRLFQCSNKTVTKRWLQKQQHLDVLIDGLADIAKRYIHVGLITYKSINGDDKFAENLAGKIGAQAWAHFGNLRGLNAMQDVDCLLIVGRQMLPTTVMRDYARGLFDSHVEWKTIYADLPVRMKDGRTYTLNVQMTNDQFQQIIYDHTSRSETLQAIGRGRLVHGPKKDVYVFANESLTTDVEVAEFFEFADYFETPRSLRKKARLVSEEALKRVQDRGFVQLKSGDLCEQLGLPAHVVKSSAAKDRIAGELVARGAFKLETTVRYRKGGNGPRTYAVFDGHKLEKALAFRGETMLD